MIGSTVIKELMGQAKWSFIKFILVKHWSVATWFSRWHYNSDAFQNKATIFLFYFLAWNHLHHYKNIIGASKVVLIDWSGILVTGKLTFVNARITLTKDGSVSTSTVLKSVQVTKQIIKPLLRALEQFCYWKKIPKPGTTICC